MQISVVIQATDLSQEALTALVTALSGQAVTVVAPETTAPAAKTRTRKTEPAEDTPVPPKSPSTPPPASDDAPSESKNAETSTDTESDAPVPTVVELRAKAQEKGATPEGKKAIKALLDEFGSKSISDVPEESRAAFLARLDEL